MIARLHSGMSESPGRRLLRWLDEMASDVHHATRVLRRNSGLMVTATVTLALGIGANTAIFSAVSAVLLRPLPFPRPDRLVMVGEDNPEFVWHMSDAAPANYLDWQARVRGFQDAMAYADFPVSVTLLINGSPRLASTALVTGNFFSVLGLRPEHGRTFRAEETWAGPPIVMLSDRLWRQGFGADESLVGKTISLNGAAATVAGIAAPGFDLPRAGVDLWTPFAWTRREATDTSFRRAHWLRVVARLRSGVSVEQANVQLREVAQQLKREYPATNRLMDAELEPLQRFLVGDTRRPLLVLLGSVTLLLLLACANVGNLLFVDAGNRQRELSLRVALGAEPARLVRLAMTESLVLSLVGGFAGLLIGWLGTHALVALQPAGQSLPRSDAIGVDWRVVGYASIVSLISGLLFGAAPAVWASRRAPHEAMTSGGGGRTGTQSVRVRRWSERLVVFEVATALVLTVAAGLLVRSYSALQHVDPGFDPSNVITATVEVPPTRYATDQSIRRFFEDLVARVRSLPGVTSAGAVTQLPLTVAGWSSDFSIDGPSAGHYGATLLHREVTPDYFRTMRVPLLRGRWFTPADRGPPYVVVINDALARTYFRGRDPLGQRITFDRVPGARSTWRTIVGVVGNEHQTTPATPPAIEAIAPFEQEDSRLMTIVARTRDDPVALGPAIRRAVAELDPLLAITSIRSMAAVRAESMARDRFLMMLLSMFGAIGLVLAVVGVYGVIAQLARSRMREMGIRLALGAGTVRVQWLILRRGTLLALVGAGTGAALAIIGTRAMTRLLFGVAPADPLTFATVAVLLVAVSAAASWLPALRSGRVDPAAILRDGD